MSDQEKMIAREELHRMVWTQPFVKLAKELGYSYLELVAICADLNIPRPSDGYWFRLERGIAEDQVPLPPVPPEKPTEIQIGPRKGNDDRTRGEPTTETILNDTTVVESAAQEKDSSTADGPVGKRNGGSRYVRKIEGAAHHLDSLTQDLLNQSKIARAHVKLSPVDLDQLARKLIDDNPACQLPCAEIIIDGTLPHVLGHETSLSQCISNVLENAIKFVPPRTLPHIRIWSEAHDSQVRLWLEDNGIGIAPQDQERIFEMFERVEPGGSYDGTGLGLSIVKKAVERMGGSVGVQSQLGKGSRFWINLRSAKPCDLSISL